MSKFCFCLVLFSTVAMADFTDVVIAPANFVPQALVAKQVAPGTSRVFSVTMVKGDCNSCKALEKTDDKRHLESVKGVTSRFDMSLFSLIWPRTQDSSGAEDWNGYSWGGGVFLNIYYSPLLELGVSPMLVQWIGPFYLGAMYELAFGCYFGHNEDEGVAFDINRNLFTGSLNVGGGTMMFMNNHGFGVGVHGGLRQIHFVSSGYRQYTDYDSRSGHRINPEYRSGYHIKDWLIYCGLDFASYSNLPLLEESEKKRHAGYVLSYEMGARLDISPVVFFSLTFSIYL